MSELGDTFRAWKEQKQAKRERNRESSLVMLQERGIEVQPFSRYHYRVGEYDFWPSTGKFIHRKTGKHGRGVMALIGKVTG